MVKNNLMISEISKPRFEFRTFGQNFDNEHYRMARLSDAVPEKVWDRSSEEIYILSRTNDKNNTKIRGGKIDIKTFVQEIEGLEQWNPQMKAEFPIHASTLEKDVFPAFMVEMPSLEKEIYTFDEFIQMVQNNPELQTVRVQKHRFGYIVNNTICEAAEVLINGALVFTLNSESTEIDDIKKTMKDIGMDTFENINYPQAIKRVIGMIDKPLANGTL